jgi:hypothetical protein
MSRTIEVRIDRLVLRGIDPSDRKALVEGLQAELSRILADSRSGGQRMQARHTPLLKLGRMPLEPGRSGSRKFGGGLARAIGKGVKP